MRASAGRRQDFRSKYGPWALVAGATEGIGRAFSLELARRGCSLILLARRESLLSELRSELESQFKVEVRTLPVDLGSANVIERVRAVSDGIEVGLVVYNAAVSVTGNFLDTPIEQRMAELDVNCRGPLYFAHHFGKAMADRKRGGIVLMSSLSGRQGTAFVSSYAGTKAYNTVLAEGLWCELEAHGVDVLACEAGATATPNFVKSLGSDRESAVKPMEPEGVAQAALDALGRGPSVVPGMFNRLAMMSMGLMSRKQAIRIVSAATRKMYGA
jgi:short-subunit dehydrogenase